MRTPLLNIASVALLLGLSSMSCRDSSESLPPPPPTTIPPPTANTGVPAQSPLAPVASANAIVRELARADETVRDAASAGETVHAFASVDASSPTGARSADVVGLQACCRALQQNALSMPPPNNVYASSAAAACHALISATASGAVSKVDAIARIQSTLNTAGMPPACH